MDGIRHQAMTSPIRQDTRTSLLLAAERLIAEKGLGTVSVKDITRAAGARNPSAVHYHFGNVETLIREVFRQRFENIERERTALIARAAKTDPETRLIALMEAALTPMIENCLEQEGRLYVRFCVQFSNDPRFDLATLVAEIGISSLEMLREQIHECRPDIPEAILARRLRQAFNISLIQAADYARRLETGSSAKPEAVIREAAATLAAYIAADIR